MEDMEVVTARGAEVPVLGFGTWQLEGEACREGVHHALEVGYRHLDTAQMYGNEQDVGRAIASSSVDRTDIFITTKLGLASVAPDRVRPSTEESLRRLGTDHVDLLLIHWPSADIPAGRTLEAMAALQDEGKIRHLGVSNFPPSLARSAAREAPVITDQVEYHPLISQDELLSVCAEEDLFLTAYSPLARGAVLDEVTLKEIAEEHDRTIAQVALRWLIQQERVAAIPKSSTPRRREENAQIFDFTLTSAEMARIGALARGERKIDPPFAPDWER